MVVIQDEFTRLAACEVEWGLITDAQVTLSGPRAAVLSLGGQSVELQLVSPEDAAFGIGALSAPSPEAANTASRLQVRLPAGTGETRIVVHARPAWNDGAPIPSPTTSPLSAW